MNKATIAIINGRPRSGKSSIQQKCIDINHYEDTTDIIIASSMGQIYDVYKTLGWDGIKTDQFRDDMSAIKQMYIRNCNGPIRDLIYLVLSHLRNSPSRNIIVFYDCREARQIEEIVCLLAPLGLIGITCKTVLIRQDYAEQKSYTNESDNFQLCNEDYDIVLYNEKLHYIEEIDHRLSCIAEKLLDRILED